MRPYELVVLLHPDLEIDADTPISKLEKIIEAAGGKVTKRDNWGKKRLAYRINKQDFAVYAYFEMDLPPQAARRVEQQILLAEEVMRHILVSRPETKPVKAKKSETKEPAASAAKE